MQEFTIMKNDRAISEEDYFIKIRFNEERLASDLLVECCGSALIIPDGKTKYRFMYNFIHSKDWTKIGKIVIRQKDRQFSAKQLKEFGKQIAHLINYYISRSN